MLRVPLLSSLESWVDLEFVFGVPLLNTVFGVPLLNTIGPRAECLEYFYSAPAPLRVLCPLQACGHRHQVVLQALLLRGAAHKGPAHSAPLEGHASITLGGQCPPKGMTLVL